MGEKKCFGHKNRIKLGNFSRDYRRKVVRPVTCIGSPKPS